MGLRIFVAGGTYHKEDNEIHGTLYFKDPRVSAILELARCRLDVQIRALMMIDSLNKTEDDRALILENRRKEKENKIIITHGTDTMEVTARVLGQAGLPKTVVLTGAMIPYKFGSSDGLFNLGSAVVLAQTLPSGVYIAMNGRYFTRNAVCKNRKMGHFEDLS
jgi:L-asparaginase